jgi:hypothetical protein
MQRDKKNEKDERKYPKMMDKEYNTCIMGIAQ